MDRKRIVLVTLVVLAVAALPIAAKEPVYKAQASATFTNIVQKDAYGLVIEMTADAQVVTDPASGFAGPFGSVQGNGSSKIVLTGAKEPIKTGEAGFELVFRSLKKKVAIKTWWWTDEKGKRLGNKNKG